jgi:hypothetical protein
MMAECVRCYIFKRGRPGNQTQINNEQIREVYEKDEHTFMRRSSRVKYLIPTDNPELVKPGFLYIRRTSRGKEFVRNRKAPEDEMCSSCRRSSTRATPLAQKEAEIDAQIAKLQAQLELSREQEQQERVGFRKPQPYLYTRATDGDQDTTLPPEIRN